MRLKAPQQLLHGWHTWSLVSELGNYSEINFLYWDFKDLSLIILKCWVLNVTAPDDNHGRKCFQEARSSLKVDFFEFIFKQLLLGPIICRQIRNICWGSRVELPRKLLDHCWCFA